MMNDHFDYVSFTVRAVFIIWIAGLIIMWGIVIHG